MKNDKNVKRSNRIKRNMDKFAKRAQKARAKLNASVEQRVVEWNHNGECITKEKDKKAEERKAKKQLRKQRLAKNYQRMSINLKLYDLLPQKIEGLDQNQQAFKVNKYAYNSLLSVDELNKCLESNNPFERLVSLRTAFTSALNGLTGEDATSKNLSRHCMKLLALIDQVIGETGVTEVIYPTCVMNLKPQELSPKAHEIKHEILSRYRDNLAGNKSNLRIIEEHMTVKQELMKIGGKAIIPYINNDGKFVIH